MTTSKEIDLRKERGAPPLRRTCSNHKWEEEVFWKLNLTAPAGVN